MSTESEIAEYVGRFTYMSGASSKAAHQIMAQALVSKLIEQGVINIAPLTTPVLVVPTVLVVREPDSATQIEVSPSFESINLIEVDLGSSFDGTPDPDDDEQVDVAREIIRKLTEGTAHLPESDAVRQSALGWAERLGDGLPTEE